MKVEMSKHFASIYLNVKKKDSDKIDEFIHHVMNVGLVDLEGKNVSSTKVPKDHPSRLDNVKYARKHKLWHYHIGIPEYKQSDKGYKTSEYILHYILNEDSIKIVDLDYHPPFQLPKEDYFE